MVLFNAKRAMGFNDDQYGKCRDKESILLPMCSKETISEKKSAKDWIVIWTSELKEQITCSIRRQESPYT